jgi:hypothetical protein
MKISGDVSVVVTEAEFAPCGKAPAPGVNSDRFNVACRTVVDVDKAFIDVMVMAKVFCVFFAPAFAGLLCASGT